MVEALNLVDPRSFADGPPHDFFDVIRREQPAYKIDDPLCGRLWSLTRYADIRKISADNVTYSSAGGIMYPVLAETGPHFDNQMMAHSDGRHDRLRGIVRSALSPRVVAQFDKWIREICVRIVREIREAGSFDAIPMIAAELPAQVIASVLGVPNQDRKNIVKWAAGAFGRMDPDIGMEGFLAAREAVCDYALELREMKRRDPGDDLATGMATAAPNGKSITDGEYRELVFTIMLAGFETTHTLIAQTLLLMAQDEEARRQVQAAPVDKLRPVLDELLRYVSPVMHMARTATKDFELHGQAISAGDHLLMWYTAANRDPEVHENPHRFDVTRKTAQIHMGFGGGGIHYCVGAHLARLEVEILLQEFSKAGISLEMDGPVQRSIDVGINAIRKLPMRLANA